MGIANGVCDEILDYDTVKFLRVKNKKVGFFNRFIQITVIGYVLGYAIIYKKGYQDFDDIHSAVTTKVKGVLYTNFSEEDFVPEINDTSVYTRLWDVPDYVGPNSENGAFFIATNVIITSNQIQGYCAEKPKVRGALCNETFNNCNAGEILPLGSGPMTGNCVNDTYGKETIQTCEIRGWCPLERDVGPLKDKALLAGTKNFTVRIKNFISFPKFEVTRRNVLDTSNEAYLNNCKYSPDKDAQCPMFVLEDIVKNANENYTQMAIEGGVIAIVIDWTCNLDKGEEYCIPTYSFKRLDKPDAKIAKGWNLRYANYFREGRRTLYKMYGIDFVIIVQGTAGKIHVKPLLINLGSGIGLLAVASFFSDCLLRCVKNRKLYKSIKYTEVRTECDDFEFLVPKLQSPRGAESHADAPTDISYQGLLAGSLQNTN